MERPLENPAGRPLSSTALADFVRETLAAQDEWIARSLAAHPQAIRSADDPWTVGRGWMPADPYRAVVFTEHGIGDPFGDEYVYKAFERTAAILRKRRGIADAGWESVNSAVHYFWIKPAGGRQESLRLNPDLVRNPPYGSKKRDTIVKALAGFQLSGERDQYDELVRLLRKAVGDVQTTRMEVDAKQEMLRLERPGPRSNPWRDRPTLLIDGRAFDVPPGCRAGQWVMVDRHPDRPEVVGPFDSWQEARKARARLEDEIYRHLGGGEADPRYLPIVRRIR